ncbi:hypothetical protein MKX01_020690 [Papaver californicum]|nr:hypothetical protein MKX01_020690 [Papaver californicum]
MGEYHDALTTPLVINVEEEHIIPINTKQTDEESLVLNDDNQGTSTFFKTCFNGINALSGVGILSVPYALASGGWLTLILLFVVAAATFYTGLLMRRCMDKGRMIVSSFMYLELFVVATGFLILEGDNLSNLFPNMSFTLGDLRKISYISATGVLASLLIILSVFWVGAEDTGFRAKEKVTACALRCLCFVLCTISYATMAVMGYLMFGEYTKSQVTLNLPIDKLSSKIAIYTTLVTPIAKYALMATPIVNAIESSSGFNYNNKTY